MRAAKIIEAITAGLREPIDTLYPELACLTDEDIENAKPDWRQWLTVVRPIAQERGYDPYRWRTVQPLIDKELVTYHEGVRDHYRWRDAFRD